MPQIACDAAALADLPHCGGTRALTLVVVLAGRGHSCSGLQLGDGLSGDAGAMSGWIIHTFGSQ